MDEAPWFRHYEEGVPRSIPDPEITLPEALDQTVAALPRPGGSPLLPRRAAPGPGAHLPAAAGRDAALRHRALPAGGPQGGPGRPHAAQLPAARGRLLRGPADRGDPREHEPPVRVAGDAGAVRGLGLRDGRAPRPVLPPPARDPRGHAGAPGDRGGRGRAPALVRAPPRPRRAAAEGGGREDPGRDGHVPLPRPREALPADAARGRPEAVGRRSPAVHRRHHGHAEGGDAHPPQPRVERPAGAGLVPERRGGHLPGGDPLLPRLRAHLGAPLRDRAGGRDRRDPPPAAGGHRPRGDPALPGEPLPRRPHALRRHQRPPEGGGLRPAQRCSLRERGGPPAARGVRAVRGPDRRAPRRGLRSHRDLSPHALHADPRRAAAGEHRPPLPEHRGAHRGPDERRARGPGRGGRARGARSAGHARLLGAARGDGRGLPRRLAAHRRRGPHGPRRLLLRGRPPEGHDRRLRLQGPAPRGGGGALHAPEDPRGGGGRRAGRLPRRDGEGLRGAQARGGGHRGGDRRVLPAAPRAVQGPAARSSSGPSCRSRWWGSTCRRVLVEEERAPKVPAP